MDESAQQFQSSISQKVALNYRLYLPRNYEQQAEWPLILFLHGRGERGNNLGLLNLTGLPKNIADGQDYPFIIAAPQCPPTSYWTEELEALNALLDALIQKHKVDTSRIYLTGLSMGGTGTWFLAARYPQRFAAIAPICGIGQTWAAQERLQHMPAWVFHGDADSVTSVKRSQEMVAFLQENGAPVKFTVYPGVDHDSWTATYNNPVLYTWFLSHQLRT